MHQHITSILQVGWEFERQMLSGIDIEEEDVFVSKSFCTILDPNNINFRIQFTNKVFIFLAC